MFAPQFLYVCSYYFSIKYILQINNASCFYPTNLQLISWWSDGNTITHKDYYIHMPWYLHATMFKVKKRTMVISSGDCQSSTCQSSVSPRPRAVEEDAQLLFSSPLHLPHPLPGTPQQSRMFPWIFRINPRVSWRILDQLELLLLLETLVPDATRHRCASSAHSPALRIKSADSVFLLLIITDGNMGVY